MQPGRAARALRRLPAPEQSRIGLEAARARRVRPLRSFTVTADAAPSKGASRLLLGLGCGLLAAVIWGGQAVVSRQSVADGISATDVTVLRFVVAAALLLPFAWRRMRPFPVGRLGWKRATVLTLMVGAPYSLLLVTGSAFAPALHTSVISPGLMPVFTALFAWLLLGEKPGPQRLIGLSILVAGIALFAWATLAGGPSLTTTWIGDLCFTGTALIWSLFGLLARRWNVAAIEVTIVTCLLSILLLPALLLFSPTRLGEATMGAILLQGFYQGALVGVGALFFYAQAIAYLGAARAVLFTPLVPAVTAVAGWALLGEHIAPLEAAGMTVAITGMVVALRAPSSA